MSSTNQNRAVGGKVVLQELSLNMLSLKLYWRLPVNHCVWGSGAQENKFELKIKTFVVVRSELVVKNMRMGTISTVTQKEFMDWEEG